MNDRIRKKISKHNDERRMLMIEAIKANGVQDADKFIDKGIPQSMLFMMELIPIIHCKYEHLPEGALKSVLDVGPQNFAGTQLLYQILIRTSHFVA